MDNLTKRFFIFSISISLVLCSLSLLIFSLNYTSACYANAPTRLTNNPVPQNQGDDNLRDNAGFIIIGTFVPPGYDKPVAVGYNRYESQGHRINLSY